MTVATLSAATGTLVGTFIIEGASSLRIGSCEFRTAKAQHTAKGQDRSRGGGYSGGRRR